MVSVFIIVELSIGSLKKKSMIYLRKLFIHEFYQYLLQQWAQKCDPAFWFINMLSCRFNPIRSQLETFLRDELLWKVTTATA